MKHSALSSLSVLSLLIGTLTLVGCGGAFSMPDSVVATAGVAPPIQGTTFGGHAPVVGAHVYLLQPGTGGYGTIATSLLGTGTSNNPGGYALQTNPATGGDPYIPAGWKYVVSDANGAWNLTGAYSCTAGYPVYVYSYGGNATNTTGTPVNTAIVQLAILGDCPATGQTNFGNGSSDQINYVYSNEVSTVAAAYVFQPFTAKGTATTNSAIYVGTSGTTQALLGIANAASTAAQLYAIQGNAQISSLYDGEGHVANYRTQAQTISNGTIVTSPNAGNGIVPEATINTLANILAACVDSTGASSTACTTLFTNATETGDSAGVVPTDIARAAMNIARYPAGNFSNGNNPTNFVTNIYGIPTGTVPYTPHLTTQPSDFTLAITYSYGSLAGYGGLNPDLEKAESVEVDQLGQIWITAQGGANAPSADRWSALGAPNSNNNTSGSGNYIYGYVSIDGGNNAWTGNANSTTGIFEAGSNGSFTTTLGSGYTTAYTVITDKAGDVYFFASDGGTPNGNYNTYGNSEMWEYNSAGTLVSGGLACNGNIGTYVYNCISQSTGLGRATIFNTGDFVAHGAIDATGDLWLTSEGTPYQIARVTPNGTQVWEITTNAQQPEFPSIDANGNGWIPAYEANTVYKITPAGASTTLTSATTGASLVYPFGSAIDGNGNVWITNRCGPNNTCGTTANSSTLVQLNGTTNKAISPARNYVPQAQYPATATALSNVLTDPLNLAIDPSGNIWITNYDGTNTNGSRVVEIIGTAAPAVTPLSLAAGNNVLGTKP